MRLLVSAACAADAAAALEGGADIVDAKDPGRGALGAVTPGVFAGIVAAVGGRRAVTAALGDPRGPSTVETEARTFASLGAAFVKVGFANSTTLAAAHDIALGAVRGARHKVQTNVVVVAYADRARECVSPAALLDVAASAGAHGVLLDTADKSGPRLTQLVTPAWLAEWIAQAHRRGLLVAIAGRLREEDLPTVRGCGADVAGVRGAACEGGRSGRIDAVRVRGLVHSCRGTLGSRAGAVSDAAVASS